ncbi:hypothetical protein ACHAXH_007297 [Discostella pseudostelligera]
MTKPPPPPSKSTRSNTMENSKANNANANANDDVVVAYALLDDDDCHYGNNSSSSHRPDSAAAAAGAAHANATASSSSSLYLPYHRRPAAINSTLSTTTTTDSADIISQWYDYYAQLYPSSHYMKRRQQEQQRLLLEQQQHENENIMHHGKSVTRGGILRLPSFIGRWMGVRNSASTTTTSNAVPNYYFDTEKGGEVVDDEHDDDDDETDNSHPYTTSFIQTKNKHIFDEIIPPDEATSLHRFHLVSERRALSLPTTSSPPLCNTIMSSSSPSFDASSKTMQNTTNSNSNHHNNWNNVVLPVRPCIMGKRSIESSSTNATTNSTTTTITRPIPHYCIVGYGQIAEFDPVSSSLSSSSSLYNDNDSSSLGQHVEQGRESNNISSPSTPCAFDSKILFTSDWQHLSNAFSSPSLATSSTESRGAMPMNDPRFIRAASIGRNCLIVSWGMLREEEEEDDDEIVFYRRSPNPQTNAQQHGNHHLSQQHDRIIGWEAVAVASPSDAVVRDALRNITPRQTSDQVDSIENKGKDEDQQSRSRLRDSRSLIVTDLIPMTVVGNDNDNDNVVLAISRLGDYVELLPVPSWVWEETPMNSSSSPSASSSTTTTMKRQWPQKDEKKKGKASSPLPNLTILFKITAFSTAQYHVDVMSLDAYYCANSSVTILAACGRRQCHGSRGSENLSHTTAAATMVSLWSISIARTPSQQQQQQQPSSSTAFPIVRVSRNGHATLENVGADISTFLSEYALERWANDNLYCSDSPPPSKRRKRNTMNESTFFAPTVVTTVTSPVVSLRFTPPCQTNVDDVSKTRVERVLLAALDFNGGVSVFDCTEARDNATHVRGDDDILLDGDILFASGVSTVALNSVGDDGVNTESMSLVCSRESTISIPSEGSRGKSLLARASQIEWWPHDIDEESSFTLATFATLVRSRQNLAKSKARGTSVVRLQRWTSSVVLEDSRSRALENPTDVFYLAMSSNKADATSVALLPLLSRNVSLSDREGLSILQLSSFVVPATTSRNDPMASPAPSSPSTRNRVLLRLSICTIRKFTDPTQIIAALLRRGGAPKALDVARRFGFGAADGRYRGDQRLMNECQIDLWNKNGDPQALKLISDDTYVIRQALELTTNNIWHNNLSLGDLLEIFREALARCESGEDRKQVIACQLGNVVRRLGTFSLVLNHVTAAAAATTGLSSNDQTSSCVYSKRFLHLFMHESLHGIAACAASKGDIKTLTVVIARNPFSLRERMGLLGLIPIEVHIRLYEHLLPCCRENIEGKDAQYLLRTQGTDAFLSHPQFFAYLSNDQLDRRRRENKNSVDESLIDVFTDDADRYHIMRHLEEAASDDLSAAAPPVMKEDIVKWYLTRALQMHNQTGQALRMAETCAAGLVRLGYGTYQDAGEFEISDLNNVSFSIAVVRLVYLYSAGTLACLISLEKLKDSISNCQQPLPIESVVKWSDRSFPSVIQLCSMELSGLFHFILENGSAHSISLIQKHATHLVDGSPCLKPSINGDVQYSSKNNELAERFEHDMAQLCLEKLKGLRRVRDENFHAGRDSYYLTTRLDVTLAMCANFISFGRSKLHSEGKAQIDDNTIMFAVSIFRATLEAISGNWDVVTESVIGRLWSIFELASSTAPLLDSSSSHDLLGGLHFRLVTFQLCKKWHDHQAFPHELCRAHDGTRELCVTGLRVVSFICSGFCEMVVRMSRPSDDGHVPKQSFDLLFDFVSDVDEFDHRFFSSAIQQSGCLVTHVFSPLLHQHSFIMLNYMLKVRPSWFNYYITRSIVLSFIRDFSTSRDGILECCEVFGPCFPDLRAEFEYQQRMLDAKEFVLNAMNLNEKLLARLYSVDHSAVDLVHTLLSIDPQVILLGCEFWSDEMNASIACADAVVYFASEIHAILNRASKDESSHVLPPMPGVRVMQLANILGLNTPYELLLVKRYMVDGALKMSLGPAAAAICYSMLCDAAFSRLGDAGAVWTSRNESQVLNCVMAVAKEQSFLDLSAKKEMCTIALRLFAIANSTVHRDIFDMLRDTEYEMLTTAMNHRDLTANPRHARMDEESELSVFQVAELVAREFMDHSRNSSNTNDILGYENNFFDRSLNGVCHDIKAASEIDLLRLFAFTGKRSIDNNESIMEKIGETILQWIVSEAFRARIGSLSTTFSVAKVGMMLNLGLSCLLECQQLGTSRILRTLNNFKAEASLSMNRQSTYPSHSSQPDQSIVQRLMDRGYSRNAAHRAVIMTSNQSYSAALTWAVSHFQDSDFDAPIYILRSEGPPACADQNLIDVVDNLLQSVHKVVNETLSQAKSQKIHVTTASVKATSHGTPILPQERFVSKIKRSSSRASPLAFQDRITDNDKGTVDSTATSTTTVIAGHNYHSGVEMKNLFVSKLPNPSTIQESHPLTSVGTLETPPPTSKPLPPNSADSSSSVEGSLSSRASIKNQIQRGMSKFGTQKLSAEERTRLALEGRRLLEEARARGRNVIAPPTEITTSSSSASVTKKI